jgi:superfamily II DNA or RNA helicase
MKKIRDMIYPERGVRIRAEDLGDKFPETIVSAELINADGVGKIYAQLTERLAKVARETKNYSQTVFTEILGARRRVELLKVPAMVSMARDAVAEGSSVALFCCFNDTVEALQAQLACPAITGKTHPLVREKLKKEFQADRITTLVLNIACGGIGISLHGKRHRVALISPSWSAFELVQCLGRVWRAGGSKSIQRILFASNTIEEQICTKVRSKIGALETLNDGDTVGIEVKRVKKA